MGLKIVLELVLELVLVLVFVDSSAGTVTNASTSTCHALLNVPIWKLYFFILELVASVTIISSYQYQYPFAYPKLALFLYHDDFYRVYSTRYQFCAPQKADHLWSGKALNLSPMICQQISEITTGVATRGGGTRATHTTPGKPSRVPITGLSLPHQ